MSELGNLKANLVSEAASAKQNLTTESSIARSNLVSEATNVKTNTIGENPFKGITDLSLNELDVDARLNTLQQRLANLKNSSTPNKTVQQLELKFSNILGSLSDNQTNPISGDQKQALDADVNHQLEQVELAANDLESGNDTSYISNWDMTSPLGKILNVGGAVVAGTGEVLHGLVDLPNTVLSKFGVDNIVASSLSSVGDTIQDETAKFYNTSKQEKLSKFAKAQFEEADGFLDYVKGVANVVTEDPLTGGQMFAKSLPHMYALARKGVVGAINFLAVTGQNYNQQEAIFIEEHGRKPEGDEVVTLLGTSGAATAVDKAASSFVLSNKILPGAVTNAATDLGIKVGKTLEKVPGSRLVAKTATAVPTEFAQGATQEALTQLGGKQDLSKIDTKEVVTSGSLEAAAAAPGAGTIQAIADVSETAKTVSAKVSDKIEDVLDDDKAKSKAIEKGDFQEAFNIESSKEFDSLDTNGRKTILTELVNIYKQEKEKVGDSDNQASLREMEGTIGNLITRSKQLDSEASAANVNQKAAALEESKDAKKDVKEIVDSAKNTNELTADNAKRVLGSQTFKDNATPKQKRQLEQYFELAQTLEGTSSQIAQGDGNVKGVKDFLQNVETQAAIAKELPDQKENSRELAEESLQKMAVLQAREQYKKRKYFLPTKLRQAIDTDINTLKVGFNRAKEIYEREFGAKALDKLSYVKRNEEQTGKTFFEGVSLNNKVKPGFVEPNVSTQQETTPVVEKVSTQKVDTNSIRNVLNTASVIQNRLKAFKPNATGKQNKQLNTIIQQFERLNKATKSKDSKTVVAAARNIERFTTRAREVFAEIEATEKTLPRKDFVDIGRAVAKSIKPKDLSPEEKQAYNTLRGALQSEVLRKDPEILFTHIDNLNKTLKGKNKSIVTNLLKQEGFFTNPKKLKEFTPKGEKDTKKLIVTRSKAIVNKLSTVDLLEIENGTVDVKKLRALAKGENPNRLNNAQIESLLNRYENILFNTQKGTIEQHEQTSNLSTAILKDNLVPNRTSQHDTQKAPKLSDSVEPIVNNQKGFHNSVENTLNDEKIQDKLDTQLAEKNSVLLEEHNNTGTKKEFVPDTFEKETELLSELSALDKMFNASINGSNSLLKGIVDTLVWNNRFITDPINQFIQVDKNGDRFIHEGVVANISLASLNWLSSRARKSLFNDAKAINRLLGRSDEHAVTSTETGTFGFAGTPRTSLAEDLGGEIFNYLGFKPKPGIDGTAIDKLKISLGQLAITAMLDNGLVTQTVVNANEFPASIDYESATNVNFHDGDVARTLFIKPNHDPDNQFELEENLNKLFDLRKESSPVLENLFKVPSFVVKPSKKPIHKVPEFLKGTFQKVTDKTRGVVQKLQTEAWVPKQQAMSLFMDIDRSLVEDMLGVKKDLSKVHVLNESSVKGKNLSIQRDLDGIYDFFNENNNSDNKQAIYNSNMFFRYEVWKNGRIGLVGTQVNPQGSKIARHLFGLRSHRVTVDPKNDGQMTGFKLAVAFGFGSKIDKQPLDDSIEQFDKLLADPEVISAVKAIQELNDPELTLTDRQKTNRHKTITQLAKKHEAIHTFDALTSLATAVKPVKNKKTPLKTVSTAFDTDIGIETDGVTSGVIIGLMQSGFEKRLKEQLAAGGIFVDSEFTDYGQWSKEPGNIDNYKRLMSDWLGHLNITKDNQSLLYSVQQITGRMYDETIAEVNSIGRDFAKNPLMITNYGAAVKRVRKEFNEKVLNIFYEKLAQVESTEEAVVLLNSMGKLARVKEEVTVEQLEKMKFVPKEFKLKKQSLKAIEHFIDSTYGEALEKAIKDQFVGFMSFRQTANSSLQMMFKMFNIKYQQAVSAKETAENRNLSKEEKEEIALSLQHLMPLIKGPNSEGLVDSILAMKTKKFRDYENPDKVTQQEYTRQVNNTDSESVKGVISETQYEDPGPSGMVMAIHNLDSSIIQNVLSEFEMLNIHDAGYYSLNDYEHATTRYNRSFFELNKDYEILNSITEHYSTVLEEFSKNPDDVILLEKELLSNTKSGIDPVVSLERNILELFKAQILNNNPEMIEELVESQANAMLIDRFGTASAKSRIDYLNEMQKYVSNITDKSRKRLFDSNITVAQAALSGTSYTAPKQTNLDADKMVKNLNDFHEQSVDPDIANPNSLGSIDQDTTPNFDELIENYRRTITDANVLSVFDELSVLSPTSAPKVNSNHLAHLRKLVKNVFSEIMTNMPEIDTKITIQKGTTKGFIENDTNIGLLINNSLNVALEMSPEEVLSHELSHAITRHAIDNNHSFRKATQRLFKIAEKHVTPEDFLVSNTPSQAELDAAQARYDYIFNNRKESVVNTKLDPKTKDTVDEKGNAYLHEFMAHALTNEQLIKALSNIDVTPEPGETSTDLFDKIVSLWDKFINWSANKLLRIPVGAKVDQAVVDLVNTLNKVEDKHKFSVFASIDKIHELNGKAVDKIKHWIIQPLINYHDKLGDQKNLSLPKKVIHTIGNIPYAVKNKNARRASKETLRRIGITEQNLLVKLVREMMGDSRRNRVWHNMLRYSKNLIDKTRKDVITAHTQMVRDSFNTVLDKAKSKALTELLLETDLSSLTKSFSLTEILSLIKEDSKLNAAINDKLQQIANRLPTNAYNFIVNQANGLGFYLVNHKNSREHQRLNAFNIVDAAVTHEVLQEELSDDEKTQLEQTVDELSTLYALLHMGEGNRTILGNVYEEEYNSNPSDNGIRMLMDLHNSFKEDSLKENFTGNKAQTIKGYVQETFNPNVSIELGSDAQIDDMKKRGFTKVTKLPKDFHEDKGRPNSVLFVNKSAGSETWVKTIVSLRNETVKGTTLDQINQVIGNNDPKLVQNFDTINTKKNAMEERQYRGIIPLETEREVLLPIYNDQGEITNYRYTMSKSLKNELLERDNRVEQVMGNMFGGIKDKSYSKKINTQVVNELYDDYIRYYGENPSDYVTLSANSTNPRIREIYQLIPNDMRREMHNVWGKDMVVREELLDLIFGYRKLALSDSKWVKPLADAVDLIAERIIPNYHGSFSKDLGRLWQEIVAVVKDFIVVKMGTTLMYNQISNTILLAMKGVPMKDIIGKQAEAMSALNDYLQDAHDLEKAKRTLASKTNLSSSDKHKLETQIARLNDNITTNPIKELVDEGIFQSIIEDIETEENIYATKTKLVDKVDTFIGENLPDFTANAYKHLFLTKDTKPYKLLLKGTQYSDFIGRYTLYHHNKNKGMSHEDNIFDVVETFVNYDVPTSREMQYINDMGLFMFTKYLLRTQRVIFRLFRDTPVSTASIYTLKQMLGDVPIVTDSNLLTGSLVSRLNTPEDVLENFFVAPGVELAKFGY